MVLGYCQDYAVPGRTINILEVGGGSASTTRVVLAALQGVDISYTFSDVSEFFVEKARVRFSNCSYMRYAVFDISGVVCPSDNMLDCYDIIIASNVVHATPLVRSSMLVLKDKLAAHGILVLRECTKPSLSADMSFGLNAAWWSFTRDPYREIYPLLTSSDWTRLLCEIGLGGSGVVNDDDKLLERVIVAAHAHQSDTPFDDSFNIVILMGSLDAYDLKLSHSIVIPIELHEKNIFEQIKFAYAKGIEEILNNSAQISALNKIRTIF